MKNKNLVFAGLFKKYRLRSEIEKLSEFANLMAEEGMVYAVSLFTRWQKGERIPTDRRAGITMIKIFVKRGGINSVDEANELLECIGMRDLATEEIEEIQGVFRSRSKLKESISIKTTINNTSKYSASLGNILKNKTTIVLIFIFFFFTYYWVTQESETRQVIGGIISFYFITAFFGALFGIISVFITKGWKSHIGTSILLFSCGLFSQLFGQIIYAYYIVNDPFSVPYPSIGDIGFFGTIPLYLAGVVYLSKALGVKLIFRSYSQAIGAIILPLLMLIITFTHLLIDYQFTSQKILTILLDFGYPLGQAIYISLSILIFMVSKRIFGELKNKIRIVIIALILQYLADYIFIYQFNEATWRAGGISDYLYFIAYLFMSFAISQLYHIQLKFNLK